MKERRGRRIFSAVAVFLAAMVLQRACTLAWGRAPGPDGGRFELSVVGLSRIAGGAPGVRTDCRWWPTYGDPTLCHARTGGMVAFRAIRFAYPMLQIALWLAVASLLLQALRVPRQRLVQAAIPATACALTIASVACMVRGARDGLAALDGISVSFGAAGFVSAVVAAVLSLVSALLVLESFSAVDDA